MELFLELEMAQKACREGITLSVGMFDGVHRGHQMLIEKTNQRARELGLRSLVLTFREHPLSLLAPPFAPMLLTGPEEKAALIEQYGADLCLLIDFTPSFAAISATDFLEKIVSEALGARYLCCGPDFRFGERGQGDVDLLRQRCEGLGVELDVCEPLSEGAILIKSTRVRQTLLEGKIDEARRLMDRSYELAGRVVKGEGRGRTIGYPTANIEPHPRRLIPENGVYAARVRLGERSWGAMMNIGVRPTFGTDRRAIEAHLFDFSSDLYGETITCEFVKRLRDEQTFPSPEALVAQLKNDEAACRRILKT